MIRVRLALALTVTPPSHEKQEEGRAAWALGWFKKENIRGFVLLCWLLEGEKSF